MERNQSGRDLICSNDWLRVGDWAHRRPSGQGHLTVCVFYSADSSPAAATILRSERETVHRTSSEYPPSAILIGFSYHNATLAAHLFMRDTHSVVMLLRVH